MFRLHGFNQRVSARVIRGDIWASNGVIHIIDQLLDKPPVIVGSVRVSWSMSVYDKIYGLWDVAKIFRSTCLSERVVPLKCTTARFNN